MRVVQLDILRAAAVLLVLGRHIPEAYARGDGATGAAFRCWREVGWAGVDLFFVLSGFLVSGLLFREYKVHGNLHVKRFLIRRGLKIYPAFYFFLALATSLSLAAGNRYSLTQLVSELLFVQNYVAAMWAHTWSLAVEEHFYLFIALLLTVLVGARRRDPFRYLVPLFLFVSAALLALRIEHSLRVPYAFGTHATPTHLRMDSLFFGVLLAYCYHFRPHWISFAVRRKGLLVLASATLIAIAFALPLEHFFSHTFGFALLYVGFGGLLLAAIHTEIPGGALPQGIAAAVACAGANSYSIYLWHLPTRRGVQWGMEHLFDSPPPLVGVSCYVAASIGFGIIMAKCLETPVLALRDRLFPSRSGSKSSARPGPDSVPSVTERRPGTPLTELTAGSAPRMETGNATDLATGATP